MFFLRRPNEETLTRVLLEAQKAELTYVPVGLTSPSISEAEGKCPRGFARHKCNAIIGHGQSTFEIAKTAIEELQMLNFGWFTVSHRPACIEPGEHVQTLVRMGGLYSLQVARILYVDNDSQNRFGLGYGTLPGYPLDGEEFFSVSWDRETDAVSYEVDSYSRSATFLMCLGSPVVAMNRRRFYRDSIAAMKRAVCISQR
jgi:uncharacterized protein (UPF0548 family)